MMRTKVILDTDIGNDIDDAICLAYLLAQPQCDLLGVTTVTGEPEKRAMMVSALCQVAGKRVPVYPGIGTPLVIDQRQKTPPQAERLVNWPHEKAFPKAQAIRFLQDTIHQHPGEVLLLTIGPLTNAGLLFATDPEIPSLLKGLIMMVGSFAEPMKDRVPVEWNAGGDPHATAIMYRCPAAIHRSVGLDVTCQVTMARPEVEQRFQHPILRPVLDFAGVWFQHTNKITFHDPLAATTIFDESICGFDRGTVRVELKEDKRVGATCWSPDPSGSHEVALRVRPERFFDHFFSVFQ